MSNPNLSSLLVKVSQTEVNEVVKAEDLQEGGINWKDKFFEPEVGNSYVVKFLPNIDKDGACESNIVHRVYYKDLPDPERKGKKITYISPGKGCPVMELFFEMADLKKSGDVIAEQKIKRYLSRKQQACAKVQIIKSPDKEQIGKIYLFRFNTFGQNAIIANLINQKLNPTKDQIENGEDKENIFDIFESSVMNIVCKEETFDGQKGRGYASSTWLQKKRGAFIQLEDGRSHEFSPSDLNDKGEYKEEVLPFVEEFVKQLTRDDVSIKRWFSYRRPEDCDNEEDKAYLLKVLEKVHTILPIIRDKSITEIENYGKAESASEKKDAGGDILRESIPDELKGVIGEEPSSQANETSSDDDLIEQALHDQG